MFWVSAHVDWRGANVKMRRPLPFTLKASTLPSPRSANVTVPAGGDTRAVQPRPGPVATSNSPLVPGLLRSTNSSPFSPTAVARIRWAGPTESDAESDHAPAGERQRPSRSEWPAAAAATSAVLAVLVDPDALSRRTRVLLAANAPARVGPISRQLAPSRANTPTCPGRR